MKFVVRAVPTLMCLVVGSTAFLLSYVALRDVATQTGAVPAALAWAVPVCIDGGILAGSAVIWAGSYHRRRRDPLAFLTVAVLLATSVVINMHHAGASPLAKWIAALPPITLLACLELVASQHRRRVTEDAHDAATTATLSASSPAAPVAAPIPTPTANAPAPVGPDNRLVTAQKKPAVAVAARSEKAPVVTATVPTPATPATPAAAAAEAAVAAPVATPRTAKGPHPSASPSQRTLRVAAAAPESSDVTSADQIRAAFESFVSDGGDAQDPALAARLAKDADVSVTYARRVLKPLRENLVTA